MRMLRSASVRKRPTSAAAGPAPKIITRCRPGGERFICDSTALRIVTAATPTTAIHRTSSRLWKSAGTKLKMVQVSGTVSSSDSSARPQLCAAVRRAPAS